MTGSYCERRCRFMVILRSGAALCGKFAKRHGAKIAGMEPLKAAREGDEYGEPRWLRQKDCNEKS